MEINCSNCGHKIVNGSEFCGNCGAKIVQPAQQEFAQQTQKQAQQQPVAQVPINNTAGMASEVPSSTTQPRPSAYAVPSKKSSTVSIIAMIIGIVSVLGFWAFPFGSILALVALVLGIIGLQKGGKGYAITGIVTSILSVVFLALIVFFYLSYCDKNPSEENCKDLKSSQSILIPIHTLFN